MSAPHIPDFGAMDFSIAPFFCACSLAVAMNSYGEQYEFLFVKFLFKVSLK